ncbi:MAG: succinate dehydrogenase assembly factor 2 [Wolbachia endosymbiont of Menacanthus eurysternus]|nr:MAG: succinate dehydrogenase assembly factor 2 [Wolbachia endosymbiont of Menacanthus eurysternus]
MKDISSLRRKLVYRSWHRGCREMDLFLGHFAVKYLDRFSLDELIEYEKIINLDDYELYCYIFFRVDLPFNLDIKMMGLIINFIKNLHI